MKKQYLLAVAAASLLLATGCQKEQELVTLGAVISQPAKTYINNRYPCWNEGDEVYVNSAVYPVSAISGSSAQIVDVVGADAYRAIFPASLVAPGSNIETGATIPVTLPATQKYQVVDGHQRVDAPMGAYTGGGTLQFYNLCSIVHVVVNNNTGRDMTLRSLKMETANAMLSGSGTATVNGTSDDGITLTSDASHAVFLRLSGATNVTLAAGAQSAFDIYVPSFPTDNVTLTLYTTDGYYFELTKSNIALRHNTYTTVTLNVDQLTQILASELVDGWTFKQAIPDNATAVVFEYNSSVTSGTLLSTTSSPVPIYGNLDGAIWRVSTNASMMNANPDCWYMFAYKTNLNTIDFGEGFNTANVTDMGRMFSDCSSLTSLDLSNFNTENVTDMLAMFFYCRNLKSLDLANFNTANVTNMSAMFSACDGLTNIDVSSFNTENVTNMSSMFSSCSGLTSLDLSNFNTANVTDMSGMLAGISLTSLDLSNFNTENVTNMSGMFWFSSNLTILDLSSFNTENVTDMRQMIGGCSGLTSLNLSNFNIENVTNMSMMFYDCNRLSSINLSNFNTENVTNMSEMFCHCSSLTSLNISNFNTENVTSINNMFYNCSSLTSLDLSNFNTSNVRDMIYMFGGCSGLTSLDLSNFDMSRVTEKYNMCNNLATNSHACTITCPLAVQSELENGTDLPTSGVTFTWVRPTSK